jgi:photosystem II stability/assembly factor-like uncharacterized protein
VGDRTWKIVKKISVRESDNEMTGGTVKGVIDRSRVQSIAARATAIILGAILLTACEAKLDLSEVEKERQQPTARFDQFQAAARAEGTLVVVGSGGVVLHSRDGGKSWARTELSIAGEPLTSPGLIDVTTCPNGSFAILDIGRRVWTSPDGQGGWQPREIEMMDEPLALTCDPAGRFWVVGGFSSLLVSDDAGESWEDRSFGEDAMLTTIQFLDRDYGVITGEFGTYYVTRDGGERWESPAVISDEFYPQDALFISHAEGWVVGLTGLIWHTADGGLTWERQPSGTEVPLYGLAEAHGRIFAVGDHATMLIHRDGAWQEVPRDQRKFGYLRVVLPTADGRVLVAGGAGTLATLDLRDRSIPLSEKVAKNAH